MSPRSGEIVVDDQLRLVPRHADDSAEMFAVIDAERKNLTEWLTWVDATFSPSDVRRYARFAESQFEALTGFEYAIRSGGVLVGGIGLNNVEWASRNAHIGYWLAPSARGRGLVTRAAAALTSHGFDNLGFHRLEIRCVVENLKSRAVAERMGYVFEGTLLESYLLHGRFRDLALYAMLAANWKPL
jgi:ribosomal-protein-serine acetyltransferase